MADLFLTVAVPEVNVSIHSEKERKQIYQKHYRQNNKIKLLAYTKAYLENTVEKRKKQRQAYYQANKKHLRAKALEWHLKNRDYALQKMREWGQKNAKRRLGRTRRIRYDISPEAYEAMFIAQGLSCKICQTTTPRAKNGWHLDHDHSTGGNRGILCNNCNCALGYAKDSPEILRKMAEYIEFYSRVETQDAIDSKR